MLSSGSSGETEVFGAVSEFCLGPGETEVGGAEPEFCPGEDDLDDRGSILRWATLSLGIGVILGSLLKVYEMQLQLEVFFSTNFAPSSKTLARCRQLRADVVLGRRAKRRGRTEAGSDDFVASFMRCESHVTRSDRASVILHEPQSCCTAGNSQNSQTRNSQNSLARSLHVVHDARCGQNSWNSVGDGVVRGRGVCVRGETKSPSTIFSVRGSACTAGVPKVACRDVGRSLTRSRPEDFPGGENRSGVACHSGSFFMSFSLSCVTWARQNY